MFIPTLIGVLIFFMQVSGWFFFYFFHSLVFWKRNYLTNPSPEKWWAGAISKSEQHRRLYSVWTSACSHSGQTAVLQRSPATLPVASYPVSCFPPSVVMRVIPHLPRCVGTVLWPCVVCRLKQRRLSVAKHITWSKWNLFGADRAPSQTGVLVVSWGCALMWTVAPATKAPGAKLPVKKCTHANVCATVWAFAISGVYPVIALRQKAAKWLVAPSWPPKMKSNTLGQSKIWNFTGSHLDS